MHHIIKNRELFNWFVQLRKINIVVAIAVVTILLAISLTVAVAENSSWIRPNSFCENLKIFSRSLARRRFLRNIYICFVIGIIFLATIMLNMVSRWSHKLQIFFKIGTWWVSNYNFIGRYFLTSLRTIQGKHLIWIMKLNTILL